MQIFFPGTEELPEEIDSSSELSDMNFSQEPAHLKGNDRTPSMDKNTKQSSSIFGHRATSLPALCCASNVKCTMSEAKHPLSPVFSKAHKGTWESRCTPPGATDVRFITNLRNSNFSNSANHNLISDVNSSEHSPKVRQNKLKRSLSDGLIMEGRKKKIKDQNPFQNVQVIQCCDGNYMESKKSSQVSVLQRFPEETDEGGQEVNYMLTKERRKKRKLVRSISHSSGTPLVNRKYDNEDYLPPPPSVKKLLQIFESTSPSSSSEKSFEESRCGENKSKDSIDELSGEVTQEIITEINEFPSGVQRSRGFSDSTNNTEVIHCPLVRSFSEPKPLRNVRKSIRSIPPIVTLLRKQFETLSPLQNSFTDESCLSKLRKTFFTESSPTIQERAEKIVIASQVNVNGSSEIQKSEMLLNENAGKISEIRRETDITVPTAVLDNKCMVDSPLETYTSPTSEIFELGRTKLEILRGPGTPSVKCLAKQFEDAASVIATSGTIKTKNDKKICPCEESTENCVECKEKTTKMTETRPVQMCLKEDSIHSDNSNPETQKNEFRVGQLVEKFVGSSDVNFEGDRLSVLEHESLEVRRESDVASLIERFSNANKRRHSSSSLTTSEVMVSMSTSNCSVFTMIISEVFTEQPEPVQASIGSQVQLRCSSIEEYGLTWLIIFRNGSVMSSDPAFSLPASGMSVEPFSTTAHESVLTVNGTEDNNGIKVQCVAMNVTYLRRCQSRKVSVIFYQPGTLYASVTKLTFV